jgi:hypothetical protein
MMRLTAQLRTTSAEARLLCTSAEWGDVLKARLPLRPAERLALTLRLPNEVHGVCPVTFIANTSERRP